MSKKTFGLQLRFAPEIREKLEFMAKQEHRPMTNLIEVLILREYDRVTEKTGDKT